MSCKVSIWSRATTSSRAPMPSTRTRVGVSSVILPLKVRPSLVVMTIFWYPLPMIWLGLMMLLSSASRLDRPEPINSGPTACPPP